VAGLVPFPASLQQPRPDSSEALPAWWGQTVGLPSQPSRRGSGTLHCLEFRHLGVMSAHALGRVSEQRQAFAVPAGGWRAKVRIRIHPVRSELYCSPSPASPIIHGKTLEVRLLVAECGIIWICGGFVGVVGDVKEFANERTTQRFADGSGITARFVTVLPVRIC
jgi:hypothetical protein